MKYIIIIIIILLIGSASYLLLSHKPKDEVVIAPPKVIVGTPFSNVAYENYTELLHDNRVCNCVGYYKCHCDK